MRYIFVFFILIGLNLHSQTKDKPTISIGNEEYKYIIIQKETEKIKLYYKTILKIEKPVYKLDKLPVVIADIEAGNKELPFYFISENKLQTNSDPIKIIIFKNVIEVFFKSKLEQILQKSIQEDSKDTNKISFESFYLKTLIHHISHFAGPSIIHDKSGKTVFIDSILPNSFTIVEEIRSDMLSLVIADQLLKDGLLIKGKKKELYKTHIAYLLYLSRHGSEIQKKVSSIQLNFFKKKGGITQNMITNMISIDILEFETICKNILKKMTKFEKNATDSETKIYDFIEQFSTIKGSFGKKEINILSPNGSENWILNETETISWVSKGLSKNIKISLWKNETFIGLIVKDMNPSQENYKWKVGSYKGGQAKAGKGYLIKIREQGGKSFKTEDISDKAFNINSN